MAKLTFVEMKSLSTSSQDSSQGFIPYSVKFKCATPGLTKFLRSLLINYNVAKPSQLFLPYNSRTLFLAVRTQSELNLVGTKWFETKGYKHSALDLLSYAVLPIIGPDGEFSNFAPTSKEELPLIWTFNEQEFETIISELFADVNRANLVRDTMLQDAPDPRKRKRLFQTVAAVAATVALTTLVLVFLNYTN